MYKQEQNNQEEQNFWVSYADLMAGLLFVFILVVGAIIIKYVFVNENLQVVKADLEKEQKALELSEDELEKKKNRLKSIQEKLTTSQKERLRLAFELDKANELYEKSKDALDASKKKIQELSADVTLYKTNELNLTKNLDTKTNKIASLLNALEKSEEKFISLSNEKSELQTLIIENDKRSRLNHEEIAKLKALLFDYEFKEKTLNTTIEKAQKTLSERDNIISLKDDELSKLEEKLFIKSKIHQQLVDELNITKVKIKNLTGVRVKVVSRLREKLGNNINIDPKTGALRFSSNILFSTGEYILKENAKQNLSEFLQKYITTLLDDPELRKNIASIVIEGHTDTQGNYLFNLELSQKRALEVMKFLYTLNPGKEELFQKYLVASGRSFADIIKRNGKEDSEASRRIEVKFTLKNEEAIRELGNFIQNDK